MSVSEERRFEMHLELRRVLGDDVAGTLMDHLPPSGWGDVVRVHDLTMHVTRLDSRLNGLEHRFDAVDRRMDGLDRRMDGLEHRMDRLTGSIRVLIGGTITVSAAIIVLLIQLNQNISGL